MSEFDAILAIADKLSKVGFAALCVLVLFGSYLGVWVWGKTHRERLAEVAAKAAADKVESDRREALLQTRNDLMFDQLMRSTGLVEQSVSIVKRQV